MPLRSAELEALRRLHRVLVAEGWDFTMIGAAVQTIIATPGVQSRFTGDLDGVVTTPSWADYERLGTILEARGFTKQTPQRFAFEEDVRVDLIPFAVGLVTQDERLAWPDGARMRVLGFAEALATATPRVVEFRARGRAGRLVPDVMLERGVRPTDERIAALEALFMAFEMGLADGAPAV